MVVAVQGLDVCVVVGGIPQFDGEVGGACDCMVSTCKVSIVLTHEAARPVKVDVHDGLCMALDCALHLAAFPVPDLDRGVLAGGCEDGPCGVECEACDGCAV